MIWPVRENVPSLVLWSETPLQPWADKRAQLRSWRITAPDHSVAAFLLHRASVFKATDQSPIGGHSASCHRKGLPQADTDEEPVTELSTIFRKLVAALAIMANLPISPAIPSSEATMSAPMPP